MLRRTPLLAALALALGATGAVVSAAAPASARPASASAVRVTSTCDGNGVALLIARKTASGGSFAKTKLTGLKHRRWVGGTMITDQAHIDDDFSSLLGVSDDPDAEPTQPKVKYAKHGTLTESVTSPKAWPHLNATFYYSFGGDVCTDFVQVRPHGILAAGADTAVDVRPRDGVVEAEADASTAELKGSNNPKVRVRITVAVTTPTGVQTRTRKVRMKEVEADVRFAHFKAMSTYTKVRVTTEDLKSHKINRLTLTRTR